MYFLVLGCPEFRPRRNYSIVFKKVIQTEMMIQLLFRPVRRYYYTRRNFYIFFFLRSRRSRQRRDGNETGKSLPWRFIYSLLPKGTFCASTYRELLKLFAAVINNGKLIE